MYISNIINQIVFIKFEIVAIDSEAYWLAISNKNIIKNF